MVANKDKYHHFNHSLSFPTLAGWMVELGAIYRLCVSVCTNIGNAAVRRPYLTKSLVHKKLSNVIEQIK